MALKRASFISADVQSDVLSSSRIPVKNRNRFLHWPTASSLRQWHFVMLPHVSMRHCFESQLSRHFCRSYLKSNKVSKSKGTRKVEYAYNFWKCADAVHLKSSRSIHAWRNYSLPKLALILKQCMCKVNGQKENYMRLLPIFNSICWRFLKFMTLTMSFQGQLRSKVVWPIYQSFVRAVHLQLSFY